MLSSDCRDRRADLIVKTGDQAEDRVSRQMAPLRGQRDSRSVTGGPLQHGRTTPGAYRLTADVGMPDFGVEFHYWRPEGVFARYPDVDGVCAALVRGAWGPFEGTLQVREVVPAADRVGVDVRCGVGMYVGDFLRDSTGSVGGHVGDALAAGLRQRNAVQ